MDKETAYLGEFEELVLIAVLRLGETAYGVKIRQAIEEVGGRFTSIGAVYATLDRLEQKGFVSSRQGEPTAERGGRAKRYFTVEPAGIQALRAIQKTRKRMLNGLDMDWVPLRRQYDPEQNA